VEPATRCSPIQHDILAGFPIPKLGELRRSLTSDRLKQMADLTDKEENRNDAECKSLFPCEEDSLAGGCVHIDPV
jgi:hypothetical protein